jgi:hypothetical protein
MNSLRTLLDILLLRTGPQNLPVSPGFVGIGAAAVVLIDFLSLPPQTEPGIGQVLFVLLRPVLYGATMWLLLKQRGFPERWLQMAAAVYAAIALMSLLRLPLLPALVEMLRQGPGATLGWQAYASLILEIWFLTVMSRCLREALEIRTPASVLVSIAVVFALEILRFGLAPLFGLTDAV